MYFGIFTKTFTFDVVLALIMKLIDTCEKCHELMFIIVLSIVKQFCELAFCFSIIFGIPLNPADYKTLRLYQPFTFFSLDKLVINKYNFKVFVFSILNG